MARTISPFRTTKGGYNQPRSEKQVAAGCNYGFPTWIAVKRPGHVPHDQRNSLSLSHRARFNKASG